MSRGHGIPSRHCEEIKKKKVIIKRDFCLEELTIKLRESNANTCDNLRISTASYYHKQHVIHTKHHKLKGGREWRESDAEKASCPANLN